MRYFTLFFSFYIIKIQRVPYIISTSPFDLATLQVLQSHDAGWYQFKYLLGLHTILFREVSLAAVLTMDLRQRTLVALQ